MTQTDLTPPTRLQAKGLLKLRAVLFSILKSQGRIALVYLAAITLAETVTTLIEPRVGMILHGLVLAVIFLHAALWARAIQRRFLMCLAMAPLIRLMSLSLPLPNFPFIYWYLVVGAPLFAAAYMAIRTGRMNRRMLGLTFAKWPLQLAIAATGTGLGYLEYIILRPAPLVSELSLAQIWLPALILLIFTGFLEELIFRSMMQYTANQSFGRFGLWYVAVVFAVLHMGYHSLLDVLFVLGVAVYFGWATLRTGSILGVTLAHGLTNIGLFLVFPFLVAAPLVVPSVQPPTALTTPGTLQPTSSASATPFLPSQAVMPAGLIAPVATQEFTRPWVPPSQTAMVPTATSTITLSPTPPPTASLPAPSDTAAATPTVCQPPANWVTYQVRSGDTLSSISVKVGINLQALREGNCLHSDTIIAGQNLYVPKLPVIPTTPLPEATSTPKPAFIPSATASLKPSSTLAPPTYTPSSIATIMPVPSKPRPTVTAGLPTDTLP